MLTQAIGFAYIYLMIVRRGKTPLAVVLYIPLNHIDLNRFASRETEANTFPRVARICLTLANMGGEWFAD